MNSNDPPRLSEHEAVEATAAAWLAERDGGWTDLREAEFRRWCESDRRHREAVTRLDATWQTLQVLRDFRPEAQRHPDRDLLRASRPRRRVSWAVVLAPLAALVVLATGLWWGGVLGDRDGREKQVFVTTPDGYQRVTLTDGSTIELNANSEVRVNFTPDERRVRLVRGEAHFVVAKNPARPFAVTAAAVAVKAVGTAFNVRLGGSDVEVLVTEGKVEVESEVERVFRPAADATGFGSAAHAAHSPAGKSGERPATVSLGANERAVIRTARAPTSVAPLIEQVDPAAVREALAWQGPRLVFVETPLADAIVQFNRHNRVKLELADMELATLPIGGSFRAENVEAFVRLLVSGGDVAVEYPEAMRIVLRKIR
jgi:transmembrane sensor